MLLRLTNYLGHNLEIKIIKNRNGKNLQYKLEVVQKVFILRKAHLSV